MLINKVNTGTVEAEKRVNAATKRAEDVEAALQREVEENSKIKGIQEVQVGKIKMLEALLEKTEAKA